MVPPEIAAKRLRICLLIDTLAMGGAEQVAVTCAVEFARRGHAVTLVTYHARNDFAGVLGAHPVRSILVAGGKVGRLGGLRRIFREGAFDVVHAYKATCLVWGLCAATGLKPAAWFGGHHALTSESWTVRQLCRLMRSRLRGWIVPSVAAAAVARRDYGVTEEMTRVVHNPVNLAVFQRRRDARAAKQALNLSPDSSVVTMVANLHPWKNYPFFLRLAQRAITVNRKVIFLSVGRDLQNRVIQAQSVAMGLGDRVRFLGHRSDVAAVLEATDVAVITSPMESFCLALAEAGAMGVPCVSFDNGGAGEVIVPGQTGFLVPLNDEEAFAARTEQLIGDDTLREAMGRAACERVTTRFSPERVGDRLMRIYTQRVPDAVISLN